MKKKTVAPATGATSTTQQSQSNSIPTKHELCLYELLKAGMKGIYKLGQCQQSYGETCLPTTISELGIRRGLLIDRIKKPHTHWAGGQSNFTRYWLANREEAKKTVELFDSLREKRKHPSPDSVETEQLIEQFPTSVIDPGAEHGYYRSLHIYK